MPALRGVADNDNFLVRGLDSLQAIELGRFLRSGLRQEYSAQRLTLISAQLIFENPTISQLSTRIHSGLSPKQLDGVVNTRRD